MTPDDAREAAGVVEACRHEHVRHGDGTQCASCDGLIAAIGAALAKRTADVLGVAARLTPDDTREARKIVTARWVTLYGHEPGETDEDEVRGWTEVVDAALAKARREDLADVLKERDEARAFAEQASVAHNKLLADWQESVERGRVVLTCAFCGEEYPADTPPSQHDALTAHVRVCVRHPMRAVEQERDALAARVTALEHALDIETLRQYHDLSFADPPSYHESGVTDLWACDVCIEKFIERAKGVLTTPEGA